MPLTPDALVYDTTSAADPQVSPDGTRLLYTVGRVDRAADRPVSNVWLSDIDGSDARQLTWSGNANREARWSPDGQSIAFVSDRVEGSSTIFVLPVAGPGEARELTRHRQAVGHLAWSPDGQSIAYTTAFDPENPDEQPHVGRAPKVRVTRRLDYKQDNRGYLGDVRTQVFVVDVASGERRRVTSHPHDHWYPQWSPDGQTLAARVSYDNGITAQLALIPTTAGAVDYVGLEQRQHRRLGVVARWRSNLLQLRRRLLGPTRSLRLRRRDKSIERLTDDLPCLPEAGFPTILGPSQPVWLDDSQRAVPRRPGRRGWALSLRPRVPRSHARALDPGAQRRLQHRSRTPLCSTGTVAARQHGRDRRLRPRRWPAAGCDQSQRDALRVDAAGDLGKVRSRA